MLRNQQARITMQTRTRTPGPLGSTDAWGGDLPLWASVVLLSAAEVKQWGKESNVTMYRVRIRRRAGISPADTIFLYKGRVLEPKGPAKGWAASPIWLDLDCEDITGKVSPPQA